MGAMTTKTLSALRLTAPCVAMVLLAACGGGSSTDSSGSPPAVTT